MTNVATKYLNAYMGFFTYRHNWRVEHGHSPANRKDAETILCGLLTRQVNLTRPELEQVKDEIVIDLITRDRHYQIAEEDVKYLESLRFQRKE